MLFRVIMGRDIGLPMAAIDFRPRTPTSQEFSRDDLRDHLVLIAYILPTDLYSTVSSANPIALTSTNARDFSAEIKRIREGWHHAAAGQGFRALDELATNGLMFNLARDGDVENPSHGAIRAALNTYAACRQLDVHMASAKAALYPIAAEDGLPSTHSISEVDRKFVSNLCRRQLWSTLPTNDNEYLTKIIYDRDEYFFRLFYAAPDAAMFWVKACVKEPISVAKSLPPARISEAVMLFRAWEHVGYFSFAEVNRDRGLILRDNVQRSLDALLQGLAGDSYDNVAAWAGLVNASIQALHTFPRDVWFDAVPEDEVPTLDSGFGALLVFLDKWQRIIAAHMNPSPVPVSCHA